MNGSTLSPRRGACRETPELPTRRPRRGHAFAGALATLALMAVLFCAAGTLCYAELPVPGTIFAAINAGGDEANTSPGHWNHLAVMGPNGRVIEAQADPVGKTVAVPFADFFRRYPEIVAFDLGLDDVQREKFVAAAVEQLGTPYRKLGSNCVTLVRRCDVAAVGQDPRWRIPDAVVEAATKKLWWKRQYEGFVPPADPWRNATTDKARVLAGPSIPQLLNP